MKHLANCLITLLLATAGLAQTTTIIQPGYTYKVDNGIPGKVVYISGQRPFNTNGDLIGTGDLSAQTRQVFDNLQTALSAIGMTLDNVTQITYHLKGNTRQVSPQTAQIASSIGTTYFSRGILPGITDLKSVPKIVRDDVLIEVEVVAVK